MMLLSGKKGFSVVEVIVGAAIVAVVVTGVASAWSFYLKLTGQSVRMAQAAILLEEGGEALLYLRDKDWDQNIAPLALNTTYYLVWFNGDYEATTTPITANDNLYRSFVLSAVNRDLLANVAPTGTNDPGTRKVLLNIMASSSPDAILEAELLLHDTFNN